MTSTSWLLGWRPSPSARQFVESLINRCAPLHQKPIALIWSIFAGIAPVLLASFLQQPIHHPLTAFLLTPVLVAYARSDRLGWALIVLGLTMIIHSILVIWLSAHSAQAALILPGAERYWQGIWGWIARGEAHEYDWNDWLPAHVRMFLGVPIATYPSFGFMPLLFGLEQLDLMNYYVGRLLTVSQSPTRAILLGWHPWSLLRGTAYTILIFEVTSYSLERFLNQSLSTRRRRLTRWIGAFGLALADAILKLFLAPILRDALQANLLTTDSV